MKGCTFKRKMAHGITWGYSIDMGKDEVTGKRLRKFESGFSKKGEADDALKRALVEIEDGTAAKPTPKTFSEFIEEWFKQHAAQNCTLKTAERYRQLAAYAMPTLGKVQLRSITPLALERLYGRLRESGGQKGRPLSVKSVRHVAGLIHVALQTAIRWKLLKVNPASACILPKAERHEARVVEKGQLSFLLDAARVKAEWLYALVVLAVASGLRRGELLALQWSDCDLHNAVLTVSKSLEQTRAGVRVKTTKSGKARYVPLPSVAVDALRAHREQQDELRAQFGTDYHADKDLVFAAPWGDYLKPNTVSPAVCLLAEKCGLKGISLHSLRHTHGSQLLSQGVPLPTVSRRLGHSNTAITAAIYSHAFQADEAAAAVTWNKAMEQTILGTPAAAEKVRPS